MRLRALELTLFVSSLLSVSCTKENPAPVYRVIGEAYVGPNELPIRAELSLRSEVVSTAKHDEKLDILDRRRRFVQVRTKSQIVGWVDSRQLISEKQRVVLEELAEKYKRSPSMGRALVYDNLNVHTDPNRYSPTFHVIQEKEVFDIVGHKVAPRAPFSGAGLEIEDETPQAPTRKKRPKKEPAIPPPPAPAAPALPENWLELSRPPVYPEEAVEPAGKNQDKSNKKLARPGAAGLPMDDLTLIRTKEGRVGWVLSNALFLQVPDEVAQYAEGNRITSYFSVGEVQVAEGTKKHWLWTTQSQKYAPFEFDGFRVFTFNARRGRYETAYRERGLRGYFPVIVAEGKSESEFSTVVEDESGKLWKKSYSFNGVRVSGKGKTPYVVAENLPVGTSTEKKPEAPGQGMFERLRKMIPGK